MTFRLHQLVELCHQEPFLILTIKTSFLMENVFVNKKNKNKKVINIIVKPVYSQVINL